MGRTRRIAVLAGALAVAVVAVVVGTRVVNADDDRTEVDVGFVRDMIDHHEQANQLALVALHGDASRLARNLAVDVLASQRYEIGLMDGWLMEWGLERGSASRDAMAWMGMGVVPAEMPGMASPAEIDALSELTGPALDRRFLELMVEHHEGGIHMAEAAAESATHEQVRWIARTMARAQRKEIMEIEMLLAALPSAGEVEAPAS